MPEMRAGLVIPHDAIVLEVTYRPGDPPSTTVLFHPFLGCGEHKEPEYGEPETLELTGDEAKAAAKRWLVPRWPPK